MRDASPVLQNRRERLEELTLEAQEIRARRELVKLEREEQDEAEQQQAEEEEREQEAAERQAELELEREQLEHERTQERARKEAQRSTVDFRCRWLEEANQVLVTPECRWLSAAQRKEIIDAVAVEVEKRQPSDAPRMAVILGHTIAALLERFQAEEEAQKQRERAIDGGTVEAFLLSHGSGESQSYTGGTRSNPAVGWRRRRKRIAGVSRGSCPAHPASHREATAERTPTSVGNSAAPLG